MKKYIGLFITVPLLFVLVGCKEKEYKDINFVFDTGASATVITIENDNLLEPSKDDYVFDGWFIDNGYNEKVDETSLTEGMTLYARWVEINQNIYFVGFDDTVIGFISQETGTAINEELFIDPPLVEGYEFSHWEGTDLTLMPEYDITFKAIYEPSYCEVNYYYDGSLVYTEQTNAIGLLDGYELELPGLILDNWFEDEYFTKPFSNDICDEGIHHVYAKMMDIETDFEEVVENYYLGEVLYYEGRLIAFTSDGYYLSNGLNAMFIEHNEILPSIELDDYVIIKGNIASDEGFTYIENILFENDFDPGFIVDDQEVIEISILSNFLLLDKTDVSNFNQLYQLTGTLTKTEGTYYISSNENTVQFYQNLTSNSISELESLLNQEITIEVLLMKVTALNEYIVIYDSSSMNIIEEKTISRLSFI